MASEGRSSSSARAISVICLSVFIGIPAFLSLRSHGPSDTSTAERLKPLPREIQVRLSKRRPIILKRRIAPAVREPQKVSSKWPRHWILRPWGSLYERRKRAVRRGLRWMASYLKTHWHDQKLGVDAVYIFLEVAQTSVEPGLRRYALAKAQALARRMLRYFLQNGQLSKPGDLLDALDLLAEGRHLRMRKSLRPLFLKAQRRYRRLKSARALYQVSLQAPWSLSMDDFFDLLINTYIMEKVDIAYPGAFPVSYRLSDLMPHIYRRRYRRVPWKSEAPSAALLKKAEDDGFLATHVAYVLNFYGRLRLFERDMPALYAYLDANVRAVLSHKDIELVAEYIDVYRSLKRDETNDLSTRLGTFFLLETQAKDGSWGPWKKETDPYDAIHYTWCAVLGLRERFFMKGTTYERRLRRILRESGPPPAAR